jgi:hypothetical protein
VKTRSRGGQRQFLRSNCSHPTPWNNHLPRQAVFMSLGRLRYSEFLALTSSLRLFTPFVVLRGVMSSNRRQESLRALIVFRGPSKGYFRAGERRHVEKRGLISSNKCIVHFNFLESIYEHRVSSLNQLPESLLYVNDGRKTCWESGDRDWRRSRNWRSHSQEVRR